MADTLLRSFRFQVLLSLSPPGGGTALADGAFQECTGLEIDMDIQEYYEGGSNDAVEVRPLLLGARSTQSHCFKCLCNVLF